MLDIVLIWLLMAAPLFFWPGCVCCATLCDGCDSPLSECWEVAIAGISDDLCTDCGNFNRTWTLVESPTFDCFRENDDRTISCELRQFGACNTKTAGVHIRQQGDGSWSLRIGANDGGGGSLTQMADYFLDQGSFDCAGENTLGNPSIASRDECQNYPATVTITPVACP